MYLSVPSRFFSGPSPLKVRPRAFGTSLAPLMTLIIPLILDLDRTPRPLLVHFREAVVTPDPSVVFDGVAKMV